MVQLKARLLEAKFCRRIDLDVAGLWSDIRRKMDSDKVTYRDVEDLTGVCFTSVYRIQHGHHPDAPSILALCKWLGADPLRYLKQVW